MHERGSSSLFDPGLPGCPTPRFITGLTDLLVQRYRTKKKKKKPLRSNRSVTKGNRTTRLRETSRLGSTPRHSSVGFVAVRVIDLATSYGRPLRMNEAYTKLPGTASWSGRTTEREPHWDKLQSGSLSLLCRRIQRPCLGLFRLSIRIPISP